MTIVKQDLLCLLHIEKDSKSNTPNNKGINFVVTAL